MIKSTRRHVAFPFMVLMLASVTLPAEQAWGKADTVTLWVDDAHTRKITVPKLDCETIAVRTKEQLTTVGLSHANISLSLTWERERGIEFDEEAQRLIVQVKELCRRFNKGSLTLEEYNDRMRELNAAEEEAREFHARLILVTKLRADAAMVELDKLSGLPADEIRESKQAVEAELARFQDGVKAVPFEGMLPRPPPPVELESKPKKFFLLDILEQHKNAIVSIIGGVKKRLAKMKAERKGLTDVMRIPKYREGSKTVVVPKLNCKGLMDEVDSSLRFRPKFYMWGLGQGATFVLKESNQYDEAAQLLILKYRQLCNEYNGGHLSQEAYLDRLQELYDAEEKARQARHEMFAVVRKLAAESHAELDQEIAGTGASWDEEVGAAMTGMDEDMESMRDIIERKKKEMQEREGPPPSLVKEMTLAARQKSAEERVAAFVESAEAVQIAPPMDMIEVWQDDAHTRKVQVARLDPDVVAQNVERRITLFISYYNFGPEMTWAKKKGLQYDHISQMLIVKYKQLCVDFNAGLLSLEAFEQRRKEIEEATERATKVREEMIRMHQRIARAAFKDLERHIDLFSEGAP